MTIRGDFFISTVAPDQATLGAGQCEHPQSFNVRSWRAGRVEVQSNRRFGTPQLQRLRHAVIAVLQQPIGQQTIVKRNRFSGARVKQLQPHGELAAATHTGSGDKCRQTQLGKLQNRAVFDFAGPKNPGRSPIHRRHSSVIGIRFRAASSRKARHSERGRKREICLRTSRDDIAQLLCSQMGGHWEMRVTAAWSAQYYTCVHKSRRVFPIGLEFCRHFRDCRTAARAPLGDFSSEYLSFQIRKLRLN